MNHKKTALAVAVSIFLLGGAAVGTVYAEPVETNVSVNVEVTQKGGVNWDKGDQADVEASGIGIPPANAGPRGKWLARRAAIVDAQRNLSEYLSGVQLTADTTMEDLEISSDVVHTQTHALVQGARIVSEGELGDGSYQVTLAIPVYGAGNSVAAVAVPQLRPNRQPAPVLQPSAAAPAPVKEEQPAPLQVTLAPAPVAEEKTSTPAPAVAVPKTETGAAAAAPVETSAPVQAPTPVPVPVPTPVSTAAEGYTGIIVDASGLGLSPTFAPVIYDEAGQVIYGISNLDYDFAINHGMVAYASSLADAEKAGSRAGSHPLVVKATAVRGGKNSTNPVNVVISKEDANQVLQACQGGDILTRAAVVFVR